MYFLDTNILLHNLDFVKTLSKFYVSSITLTELEEIKISARKTEDVRYEARQAVHYLIENKDKYETVIYIEYLNTFIAQKQVEITPDTKIIASAAYIKDTTDIVFLTNDLLCGIIANKIFQLNVESLDDYVDDEYKGYLEKTLSDNEMAYFYEHITENIYDLLPNEYLIIKNESGQIVDKFRWDGYEYQNVKFPTIKSNYFGSVKPYNGDVYQQLALNSFSYNQITMIKGAAGTGKSYLAIGYLLWLLEKHKIDKIIIFANPTPTMNSAKIGFLPGSQLEKLIDSSVGNMLSCKLGDKYMIEQLANQNKLSILPMCDIRGFDTTGLNCGVYITESQNLDISLMKLALQRIGEDSVCIIDGDYNTQCDLAQYSGSNNGMRRMSEVFRGQDFYGEVELKNIFRSKIAAVADMM